MIVRAQPSFKDVVFTIHGSIVPWIIGRLVTILFVSVLAVLAAREHPGIFAKMSAISLPLIGIALSVFMSFRNNMSVARAGGRGGSFGAI